MKETKLSLLKFLDNSTIDLGKYINEKEANTNFSGLENNLGFTI